MNIYYIPYSYLIFEGRKFRSSVKLSNCSVKFLLHFFFCTKKETEQSNFIKLYCSVSFLAQKKKCITRAPTEHC